MPDDEQIDDPELDGDALDDELDDEPATVLPEVGVAFTPRQILGGFVLLAALIVLLRRRRKGEPSADAD